MGRKAIGQTGKTVLSVDRIHYKLGRRQTARYRYDRLSYGYGYKYRAWIVGPFHSRIYGAVGYGTTRARAKAALQLNLANNYRYFGVLMFSDHDESDSVGVIDPRLIADNALAAPITSDV